MRYCILFGIVLMGWHSRAQIIIGTWQLTEEKTCFDSQMEKSDTEKELEKDMGSSRNGVARIIKFDKKGNAEDGVFSIGKKKAAGVTTFRYKIDGLELLLLDNKSGLMTQQLVIDTLTASTLKVHSAKKDCEIKTFTRIK